MPIPKEAGTLGMPWEQSYGYAHPDGPVLRERQEGSAQYGATLDNVVEEVIEEVIYVTVAGAVRAEAYAAGARSWRAPSSSRRASHSRAR